ncbi:MAG: hypothetical protein HRU19_13185 [Pseudobacteriovorax sp.]|nr:hypothetical protein [Pseudobacteriovorax sp.]
MMLRHKSIVGFMLLGFISLTVVFLWKPTMHESSAPLPKILNEIIFFEDDNKQRISSDFDQIWIFGPYTPAEIVRDRLGESCKLIDYCVDFWGQRSLSEITVPENRYLIVFDRAKVQQYYLAPVNGQPCFISRDSFNRALNIADLKRKRRGDICIINEKTDSR